MTARSTFEARCWEALATHGRQINDHTPVHIADVKFVDTLLKAWDATIARHIRDQHRPGDTPAERRAVLYEARTDIGGQPWRATETARMAGRT